MSHLSIFAALLLLALAGGCVSTNPGASSSESVSVTLDSLDDWETLNGGEWTEEDGVLTGTKDAAIDKHCLLLSKREFADFRLSLEYQALHGNSGFYFRLTPAENGLGFAGYHAEIDANGTNAGGLYDVAVDWLHKPDEALVRQAFRPGEWNVMTIEAVGRDVKVRLNGHLTTELTNDRSAAGRLGVQLHAGEATRIRLKNLRVTEL